MRRLRADSSKPAGQVFSVIVLLLSLVLQTNVAAADTTPPTLRIVEPATGTEVGGDTLTVEIEYRDAGSGIAAHTLHVVIDGKDYAGQFDQHNRGASGQMRLPKNLPVGDHQLTVEIADRAGNVARADALVLYGGPPDMRYHTGLAHAKAGRWKQAEASFLQAVKFNPKDTDAYVQLGHAYLHLKRYSDAATAYRQATTLRPDNVEAFLSLGDASMLLKDYGTATTAYQHASTIDSHNARAFKALGIVYRADRKYGDARQAFGKARRLNPMDDDIYSHVGLMELAQKNYLLAELSFRRALLLNPKSTTAYIGLGDACLEQAQYEKAIESFNEAAQLNPESANARFGLGLAYWRLKDRAKAQEQATALANVDKALSDELTRRFQE
jgi:Flp pilus assembly protein TadD